MHRVEIITLDALRESVGIGRLLIEAVAREAQRLGARQLLVMTTNDKTRALRFYERAGFVMQELRTSAVQAARRLKPSIPQLGDDGIPVRDEIDLVRDLRRRDVAERSA